MRQSEPLIPGVATAKLAGASQLSAAPSNPKDRQPMPITRQTDRLDNPVTTGLAGTLDGVNAFIGGFLGYRTEAVDLLPAADADPDAALAQAYAAALHMFAEAHDATANATPYLARAEAAAKGATEREQLTVKAVGAWVRGDMPAAIRLHEETVARFPRDLVAAKLGQYHAFNLGDSPTMLRIIDRAAPHADEVAELHGMRAFALEQCHLIDEAEAEARAAIRLRRDEPWAHHAIAHVCLSRGRTDDGLAFMREMSETWVGLNSFMSTHNWWHLCLFLLDRDRIDAVFDIFDGRVWGVWKEYSQDQANAVSLLMRLELAGVDVGDRWADVATYLARRTGDHVQPFLDLHYLYGLARAGRWAEAEALQGSLHAHAHAVPAFLKTVWGEVAVPAADGLLAHARGDWADAVRGLGRALPRMTEIGGSHAQRDLFEQVYLDALIRAGRLVPAQQMLELRRAATPDVPANLRALARVYGRLGLDTRSAALDAQAEALSRRYRHG